MSLNNIKVFAGALIAAGLMAACDGEVQNAGNTLDDTGYIENSLDTTKTMTTGSGETVICELTSLLEFPLPSKGFSCRIAGNFLHQYRTGWTVVFGPPSGVIAEDNGYVGGGILAFTQSLYAGPQNGGVSFKGGTSVSIFSNAHSPSDGYAANGVLDHDTCLVVPGGRKVACKGGVWMTFDINGYPSLCQVATNITCQQTRGVLDLVSGDLIEGWAQDMDAPEATTQVELYFDGQAGSGAQHLPIQANRYRSDLCTALGSCNHAFSITPPSQFCDGQPHTVYAYAVGMADGTLKQLHQSPKSFSCRLPRARGGLDQVSATAIEGWVQDLDAPQATAYADLYFDGQPGSGALSRRVYASLYRGDLCTRVGSCDHGFSITPPQQLCDGQPHTVYAYEPGIEDGHIEQLTNSPKTFVCP